MSYDTLTEIEWEQVQRVWDLLDEGKTERARIELKGLLEKRPGHPDLRIVDAAVSVDEGEAERALRALEGAERSADPALFFHLRSTVQYELGRFERARADAERALAVRPDSANSHDLLGRILDHLGDEPGAREHREEAGALDPEAFPAPLEVPDGEFDRLVEKSLTELPPRVREHLSELPVVVEPLPRVEILTSEQPPLSPDILGLFVGRDLLERRHDDLPGGPGAIFLFRKNLLRVCRDHKELENEVRITVQHEVGHLLGLDEDDLEQWGLA